MLHLKMPDSSDAVGRTDVYADVSVHRVRLQAADDHLKLAFDALHIACAERAAVDVLLTTDDRLRRRAQREASKLAVRVENPAKWYPEAIAP